jgi:hypothetical protein
MKKIVFGMIFFLLAAFLFAQSAFLEKSDEQHAAHDGMYLVPQTLYIGDRGRLVLPLGTAYAEIEDIIITETNLLPISDEIVISRMEIETQSGNPRLIVDFRSYVTGIAAFPILKIGTYEFAGITVYINSLLETDGGRVLSKAAPPLQIPGTLSLVYGSIIGIVLFLLILIMFVFQGIPYLRMIMVKRQRRFAFRVFKKSIQKIRNAVMKNDVSANELLAKASHDFRIFLSFFTKMNCLSLVPKEFLHLSAMMNQHELSGGEVYIFEHAEQIYYLFTSCDELRFSGNNYETERILHVLDDMSRFCAAFESSEKVSSRKMFSKVSEAVS